MTIALSNALADTQSALLASQFNGGFIRLFSGPRPETAASGETGALLGIVSNNGLAGSGLHFTSSGSVMQKADEPWLFYGLASGTATWFRLVRPGDTGLTDGAALRIDGDIGTVAGEPGDMNWISNTVTAGVPYTLDQFFYLIQPVGH